MWKKIVLKIYTAWKQCKIWHEWTSILYSLPNQISFLSCSFSPHSIIMFSLEPTLCMYIYRVFIIYCVFLLNLKYSGLWPFSVFLRRQCVYTHRAGRTAELAEFRKITKGKNTIFNEHPVSNWSTFWMRNKIYIRKISSLK